jgi:hypothetical protein
MTLLGLPDDQFDERFDGAAALERDHGVVLTRLQTFVEGQVKAARAP